MKQQLVVILDHEDGQSRLLTIDGSGDGSGFRESSILGMDSLAGEVEAQEPDLILVNRDAVSLSGENLAQELNRLLRFQSGYAWDPAPGEREAE